MLVWYSDLLRMICPKAPARLMLGLSVSQRSTGWLGIPSRTPRRPTGLQGARPGSPALRTTDVGLLSKQKLRFEGLPSVPGPGSRHAWLPRTDLERACLKERKEAGDPKGRHPRDQVGQPGSITALTKREPVVY